MFLAWINNWLPDDCPDDDCWDGLGPDVVSLYALKKDLKTGME